jgi:hypothetical protein
VEISAKAELKPINLRQYSQQQQSPLKGHGIGRFASEVSDVPFEEKGKIDF